MRAVQSLTLPALEATVAATPDHVRALEAALVSARAAEERFRGLVESIQAIPYIADWDALGTIRYISPQVEGVLGYPAEQWYAGPDPWEANLHADDRERVLEESSRTYTHERDFTSEYRMYAADGRVVWIAERETIVRDAEGRPSFCHGVMFDITRLKTTEERLVAAESALREERDLAQRYLDVARTLLLVLDESGRVRLLNQHGHELVGYPAGALIGCDWFETMLPPETFPTVRDQYAAAMGSTEHAGDDQGVSEWELLTASGERRMIAWRHTLLRDQDGRATGAVASGEDITDRLRAQAEIQRLAYSDPLTGLANRSHFEAELRAAVTAGGIVGLLFVDLDRFKLVNDTLGHGVGDELLRAVGGRLTGAVGDALVGRYGGDEFLVLLPALDRSATAYAVAARVAERLAEPFAIEGHALTIRASVGCAVLPDEAADADALLGRADAAMYRDKRSGEPEGHR